MKIPYLLLASAISISLVSATFSIIGLSVLFSGAFWSVIIMGTVLEVAKLITAVWLHANWKIAGKALRAYLFMSVIVLVGITSMGIFGYLSKAHIEHQRTADKVEAVVSKLDQKIQRENLEIKRQEERVEEIKSLLGDSTSRSDLNFDREEAKIEDLRAELRENISLEQKTIEEANARAAALDAILVAIQEKGGFSRKKKLEEENKRQKPEREAIAARIADAETRMSQYKEETSAQIKQIRDEIKKYQDQGEGKQKELMVEVELASQKALESRNKIDGLEIDRLEQQDGLIDLEAEIGPVKYVVALLKDFGFADDMSNEDAVRMVTVVLMCVFDPLAVLMLLAAASTIRVSRRAKLKDIKPDEPSDPLPPEEDVKDLTLPPWGKKKILDEGLPDSSPTLDPNLKEGAKASEYIAMSTPGYNEKAKKEKNVSRLKKRRWFGKK
jgi:hypothetical protein